MERKEEMDEILYNMLLRFPLIAGESVFRWTESDCQKQIHILEI